MTVSRVINNMHGVSDQTAARIRGLIEEMGYVPPPPAQRNRRIKGRRKEGVVTENITFMIPDTCAMAMRTPITSAMTQGIADVLSEKRIELILSHLQRDGGLPMCIERGKVDGVIMRGGLLERRSWKKLERLPMVEVFAMDKHHADCDLVNPDVEEGLRMGLQDLKSRGIRRAAYVLGEGDVSSPLPRNRHRDLLKHAKDLGLDLEVLSWNQSKKLLPRVEGVLFKAVIGWDLLQLLSNLEARGRAAGDSIELAVADFAGFCPDTDQRLTMVDLEMSVVGARAAECLLRRMREPGRPPETILVKPEIRRLE